MARLKKHLFLLLVFIGTTISFAQTTFTVNTTVQYDGSGTDHSMDFSGHLLNMIANAVVRANAGEDVTILLEAGGLIQCVVANYLTHTAGKITITADPNATNEGINGFGFIFHARAGDFEISNLRIENCVEACRLYREDEVSFSSPYNGSLFIKNNTMRGVNSVFRTTVNEKGLTAIVISDNDIETEQGHHCIDITFETGISLSGDDIWPNFHETLFMEGMVIIENNLIKNIGYNYFGAPNGHGNVQGIRILRKSYTSHIDSVNIINNELSGFGIGIYCYNPISYWEYTDNTISNCKIGFRFDANPLDVNIQETSVNFINHIPTSGVHPVKNVGNTIINSLYSFYFNSNAPVSGWPNNGFNQVNFWNYDMEGAVYSDDVIPVSFHNTTIKKTPDHSLFVNTQGGLVPFKPITNAFNTNNNFAKPINLSAIQNGFGEDIAIQFDLSGYLAINGPFRVEVFNATMDNSLMESILQVDYDFNSVNVTQNEVLENVFSHGKIGIIISSKTPNYADNDPTDTDKLGTSEVAFVEVEREEVCSEFSAPGQSEKYWMSAWVSIEGAQVETYKSNVLSNSPRIELNFIGVSSNTITLYPEGDIIDGWQRIVGSFTIPANTLGIEMELCATFSKDVYFDDIRLHPFNASMKSYVYDGETFWLTSELDDNNFATFYEYDNEGGLIRIKKETSRGIVTIQETRSSSPKKMIE